MALVPITFFGCLALLVLFALPNYELYDADLTVLAAIGALGLNLITGYAGQASIGAAAFLAIGAFAAAGTNGTMGFVGSVVVGGLAAAFAGLLVGIPSLRVRGLYLIITTLVFQYVVQDGLEIIENKQSALAGYSLPPASIGGLQITSSRAWFLLLLVVLAICAAVAHFLTTTKPGRAWALIREQEVAASVAGVDVARYKVSAFVISSGMLGVAGALGGFFVGQISYDQYDLNLAISYVAMIIIGGTASISGSIIGAIVIIDLPLLIQHFGANAAQGGFLTRNLSFVELGVNALLLIVFLLVEPRGLVHVAARLRELAFGRRTGRPASTGSARAADPAERLSPVGDPRPRDQPALTVEHISVRYQHAKLAVNDVSIDVRAGEIVGVIGPNGAGRTSLLAGIAGLVDAKAARIQLRSESVLQLGPKDRARKGIVLVPEREKVFPHLTVGEHLDLAATGRIRERQRQRSVVEEALGYFPALERRMSSRAGHLSGGERQMLALAAGLCLDPAVMLIDEMSLGLAHGIVIQLARTLRQIADGGIAILLVEQSIAAVEDLVDRLHTMHAGEITWSGPVSEFRATQKLSVIGGIGAP